MVVVFTNGFEIIVGPGDEAARIEKEYFDKGGRDIKDYDVYVTTEITIEPGTLASTAGSTPLPIR